MGRLSETDGRGRRHGLPVKERLGRVRPSVRWLIGSVGCGLAGGGEGDDRYHLMPRERQFYDAAAAEDEEGEREWSGENGRREKLLTDREGGRENGTDKQKLACIRLLLLFVCFQACSPTRSHLFRLGQSDSRK